MQVAGCADPIEALPVLPHKYRVFNLQGCMIGIAWMGIAQLQPHSGAHHDGLHAMMPCYGLRS